MKPLWTCPTCGHRFVTANVWHSCGRYRFEDHFRANDTAMRALFDRLEETIRSFGAVAVYPQKTRIVFQVRARFVGVSVRRRWLVGTIWLKRRASHPLIWKVAFLGRQDYVHHFKLTSAAEIDAAFRRLLEKGTVTISA
jgi:hypothetical protein